MAGQNLNTVHEFTIAHNISLLFIFRPGISAVLAERRQNFICQWWLLSTRGYFMNRWNDLWLNQCIFFHYWLFTILRIINRRFGLKWLRLIWRLVIVRITQLIHCFILLSFHLHHVVASFFLKIKLHGWVRLRLFVSSILKALLGCFGVFLIFFWICHEILELLHSIKHARILTKSTFLWRIQEIIKISFWMALKEFWTWLFWRFSNEICNYFCFWRYRLVLIPFQIRAATVP